jgi:hypothetical protein
VGKGFVHQVQAQQTLMERCRLPEDAFYADAFTFAAPTP